MRIHIRLDLPVGMIAYDDAGGKVDNQKACDIPQLMLFK